MLKKLLKISWANIGPEIKINWMTDSILDRNSVYPMML